MIVPSMTLEEIRKEIDKDYPILFRKMDYQEHDLRKKLHKFIIEKGYSQFYEYNSKYKNHWMYRIQINKNFTEDQAMMIYHNGRGHVGIGIADDKTLLFHTGHFFERYNERRKLGLKSFNDIVRAYMSDNKIYDIKGIEEITPSISTIIGKIESGIVLGTLNRKLNLAKMNTFLPFEMLGPNQKEHLSELIEIGKKYKDTSGQIT
jgi:hypothetical protein